MRGIAGRPRRRSPLASILGLVVLVALGGAGRFAQADHADGHPAPVGIRAIAPGLAELLDLGEGFGIDASGEDEFLDPDVAFVLSAAVAGPGAIEARWDIAEGYYLYRDKFQFRAAGGSGATLGEAGFPKGKIKNDEYFGRMEVYYGSVAALVPVSRAGNDRRAAGGAVDIDVTYQGCAEAGLCYPPITKTVSLLLPAAWAGTGVGAAPAASKLPGPVSEGETREAPALSRSGTEGAAPTVANPSGTEAKGSEAEGLALAPDAPGLPGSATRSSLRSGAEGAAPTLANPSGTEAKGSGAEGLALAPGAPSPGSPDAPSLPGSDPLSRLSGPGASGLPGPGMEGSASIELPEQDRIAAALTSGNRWLVILSLFGAGLLLTFTPCVLPMVPILSGIIVGQRVDGRSAITTRRAFMLSLIYVLAMALTYAVAGVVTGLFGANLAAAFQDPWIVSGFALVFVLLALSMFGFYDLQIPASWQAGLAALSHRQQSGTYAGVGAMGALSALIVGPCVAAPLAGVLIYIGRTGDPVLGGIALFALGMGMGVPLIVAGVSAGTLLPKAGAWMHAVKAVFGVMLLAVAIYLLERVAPEPVTLLMWAALLIVCSIYMGALDSLTAESGGWRRLWKGAGLVVLVYGVLVLVGAAGGQGDLLRPLKGIGPVAGEGAERELAFRRVKGVAGLDAELDLAAARGQAVMLDYYADWCVSCKEMERFTFSDSAVQAALSGVLLLQTDVTANDALDKALLAEFGLFGPPAILFFGPDGRERRELRVVGFMNAGEFRRIVERATSPPGVAGAAGAREWRRS